MTVENLLAMSDLKGLGVIAGHKGTGREIRAVSVMDAPDSYKWLKGGEFILTSGFMFGGDAWQMERFTQNLIDAGGSALGVKRGRFISEIPENVIKLANESLFPIVEIPHHFGWSEIIAAFYGKSEETAEPAAIDVDIPKAAAREQLYHRIICHLQSETKISNEIQRLEEMRNPDEKTYAGIMLIDSGYAREICDSLKEMLGSSHFKRLGASTVYMTKDPGTPTVTAILEFSQKVADSLLRWQYTLYDELNYLLGEAGGGTVGIGGFYPAGKEIVTSYAEANEALLIGKALWEGKSCYFFPLLSAYSALRSGGIGKVDCSSVKMLEASQGKLSFDAVETVETYIECGSYKTAAAKLYVHENTLRYRLQKIEDILHLNIDDAMVRNALIAQIKCCKLMKVAAAQN